MRPLPYASGKRAVLCVTARWKMRVYVRGREWEESCMQIRNRRLCLLRDAANGTVLLGIWKALRVTGAFVGRGVQVVLRCIYIQLD